MIMFQGDMSLPGVVGLTPSQKDIRMKRSGGATDADGGGAGKIRARPADTAPAGPAQFKDWDDLWANAKPFTDDMVEAVMEQQREDIEIGRWLARRRRGD